MRWDKKVGRKIARKGFKISKGLEKKGDVFVGRGAEKTIGGVFKGFSGDLGSAHRMARSGISDIKAAKTLYRMSGGTRKATRFLAKGGAAGIAAGGALAAGGLLASRLRKKRKRVTGKYKIKE